MLRIQFLLSVACVLILVTEVNAAGPDQNDLVIPAYCRNFRLDQVPEAARLREELIEKALVSKDWDKERGRIFRKSQSGGLNKFVFKILSESQTLRDLLATCPSKKIFLSIEKVRIIPLKDLALPAHINELGKVSDKVPADAIIFIGQ